MAGLSVYKARIRDNSTGALTAILTRWRTLKVHRRVNLPDLCHITLDGEDDNAAYFLLDSIVEVWRNPTGSGTWACEYEGLHRGGDISVDEDRRYTLASTSFGLLELLARRIVMGYAGTAYTEKTGVAETVLKAFVEEQCVSGAVFRVITGLSVEADAAGGNSITVAEAWRNLLDVLTDHAGSVGGGDISVEFDSHSVVTATFKWYSGQLGTDRSWGNGVVAPVVFGVDYGNVRSMTYSGDRSGEVTAVIVGGENQESSRSITTVTDAAAIAESPWNRCEVFVNASNAEAAELTAVGDSELAEGQARYTLDVELRQTDGTKYGVDFFLGDIVTVVSPLGTVVSKKIVGVLLELNAGDDLEKVTLEVSDVLN